MKPKTPTNPHLPKISVVIPAYNEEQFIPDTLKSLKNQTHKPLEIIVVDNKSSDKTAQVAQKLGARVIFEPTMGISWARQKGFMAAHGEIIATTDADTQLPKNWLETIAKKFTEDENLVFYSGIFLYRNGSFLLRTIAPIYLFLFMFPFSCYSGANLAVRRLVFIKSGGFNTGINVSEDTNLGRKLKKYGKVRLDPFFFVSTSARRYQKGILIGLFHYQSAYFRTKLKKEKSKVIYRPIRNSSDLPRRAVSLFTTTAAAAIVLLFIFFFTPKAIQAKVSSKSLTFGNHIRQELIRNSSAVSQRIKKFPNRKKPHGHQKSLVHI